MYKPSVSVVVCTYNRADTLADALRGTSQLDYPNFEIVVVNGPSQDETSKLLGQWRDQVKIVECDVPNLAASRNLGIAASAGEIVCFIDDDAVPHPQWLSRLSSKYADEHVGGVGGFTVDNTGSRFQSRKTICDRFGNAHDVTVMFDERQLNRVGSPLYPSLLGTNSSFRRRALVEINGFDLTFAYYLDETDVCLRLVDAGYQILYEPSALVFHQFAASEIRTPRRIKRTYYPLAVSKAYFIAVHGRHGSMEEAGRQLKAFREKVLSENEALARDGMITNAHRTSLDQDLMSGIERGIEAAAIAAASSTAPRLPANPVAKVLHAVRSDNRMRIALVCQNYSLDTPTGIGRWTWMLAKGLSGRGHSIHVITRSEAGSSTRFVDGYWLHGVPDDPSAGDVVAIDKRIPNSIAARAAAVRQALRYVKSFGLDIVSFPIWDVEGIECLDEPNVSFALSLHTTFGLTKPHLDEWKIRPLQEHFDVNPTIAAEHRLLADVPTIIANSSAIVRDLVNLSGVNIEPKTTIVPHGTPDPFLENPARKGMRLRTDGLVKLLYAGRFETRKGFDIAARVFDKLLRQNFRLEIDIVGEELSPRTVAWLKSIHAANLLDHPHVRFGGIVDRARLDDMYSIADIVVMPSRYESFGLVAIEAMAAGAPVVALKVGGLAEVIEHGKSGYLIDHDGTEVATFVRYLTDMLRSSNLRRELSEGARLTFEKRFTSELMIEGVEDAFRAALRKKEEIIGTGS